MKNIIDFFSLYITIGQVLSIILYLIYEKIARKCANGLIFIFCFSKKKYDLTLTRFSKNDINFLPSNGEINLTWENSKTEKNPGEHDLFLQSLKLCFMFWLCTLYIITKWNLTIKHDSHKTDQPYSNISDKIMKEVV